MKIITEYNQNIIKQYFEDTNIGLPDFPEKLFEEIMYIKEAHIRKALINLGWTPPNEE